MPCGLHRFEPVAWTGLLPPRAMLLTRQGISLTLLLRFLLQVNGDRAFLPVSVGRPTVRTISYPTLVGFRRTVSEDSECLHSVFPADYLHPSHCHAARAA